MAKRLVNVGAKCRVILDRNTESCAKCMYKAPWHNLCHLFRQTLQRKGQRNGGFHHIRCKECVEAEKQYDHLAGDVEAQEKMYREVYRRIK